MGNLPRGANEALLRMAFGQDRRKVAFVAIGTDSKGQLQSFGVVDMATHEDARSALGAWNGRDLDGRNLTVSW